MSRLLKLISKILKGHRVDYTHVPRTPYKAFEIDGDNIVWNISFSECVIYAWQAFKFRELDRFCYEEICFLHCENNDKGYIVDSKAHINTPKGRYFIKIGMPKHLKSFPNELTAKLYLKYRIVKEMISLVKHLRQTS